MASTTYGTNDAETVKLWSRRLFREALNATTFRRFMGPDSNSMIQIVDDTSKGPGDRITVTLRTQLSGDGVSADSTLEGQEEALITHTQNITIDQLRHAVRSSGRMTEQRVPFSLREEARLGLQDWWADRIDTALANQLGANNAQSDTRFTGSQAVTAADANHHLWPDANTADENLGDTVSDQMSLTLIDDAVETAKTATFPMRPLMVGGEPYFVCIMHPNQARDLRTNTATGQWLDIQKAAMQGGRIGENPIFTGAYIH